MHNNLRLSKCQEEMVQEETVLLGIVSPRRVRLFLLPVQGWVWVWVGAEGEGVEFRW